MFLDAIASPSSYPCRSVSQWLMFSDFLAYSACNILWGCYGHGGHGGYGGHGGHDGHNGHNGHNVHNI